jgi:integrase
MAHSQAAGKHLMVQRQFARCGIRRMYRSSGTSDPKVLQRINDMLAELADEPTEPHRQILQQLNQGKLSFLEVLAAYKKLGVKGVEKLASDSGIRTEDFSRWLDGHPIAETTRASYLANYTTLMKWSKQDDTMRSLPIILDEYRKWCVKNKRNHRAWNIAMSVCKAWVRATLSARSEVYQDLRSMKTLKRKGSSHTNPYFSPRDVQDVMQRLPDGVGDMLWTMALHGLGPKEYLFDGIRVEGDGLHIRGQKHEHRDRVVPLVVKPAPVVIPSYRRLYELIKKASDKQMRPYDLRRSYSRWLLGAGVISNRAKMYQGHTTQDQTDTYAFHDARDFLKADALLLQNWLEAELQASTPSPVSSKIPTSTRRGPGRATPTSYRPEVPVPTQSEVERKRRHRRAART